MMFSARTRLDSAYKEWLNKERREELKVEDCSFNVITFLDRQGLLDKVAVDRYLIDRCTPKVQNATTDQSTESKTTTDERSTSETRGSIRSDSQAN